MIRWLLAALGTLVLGLAVWVVSRSPATTWVAGALALPTIGFVALSALAPNPTLSV